MPVNCLGNEVSSTCVLYTGPDIPLLEIKFGDNLDDVLLKIANANTPSIVDDSGITTDSIMSKSISRSTGSVATSKIIKRDFTYTLTPAAGGTTLLNWDLVPVIRALPSGYTAALTRVKITGKPTNGSNLVVDSRSPGASLVIPIDRYPVTIDFSIRVVAPSGNIDLTNTLNLVNPSFTGPFRAILDAIDLNPSSGVIALSDHINSIEEQIQTIAMKQDTNPNLSTSVEGQGLAIEELQGVVSSPSTFTINYSKDGASLSGEIKALITDLYTQIKTLKDKDASHQQELASLRSQIDSLS